MKSRSDRIFAALQEDLDVIVIMNGNGHLKDYTFKYVSGVTRGGYEGCSAILKKGARPTLVVSRLETESAGTAPDCDVVSFKSAKENRAALKKVLSGAKRVGVNANAIVLAKANLLTELAPDIELVDVSDAISDARLVKDADEVARVRKACALTSDVAAAIPGMLREGMTEKDLANEIAEAIQRGGGQVAFDTIVCFGETGSEPHYSPGDVRLEIGHMILIDFGSLVDDYCSDITRMYLFGKASAEQRRMFDVVHDAQAQSLAATRAGATGKEVHLKAQEIIDATEFKGRFIHGLGHSIGLEVHDGPGLSPVSKLTLAPGMIMTVEPGVYVPGLGGVRIEDTVLITENGPEILTPVTKELVEVPRLNELEEGLIHGARLTDLLRPRRLFTGLAVRPQFVLPMLLLCAAAVFYSQLAVGPAMPKVIPQLLENSVATESELAQSFRWMVLVLASLLPIFFLFLTALGVWLVQLVLRGGQAYFMVLSLVSYASLWVALGFVAKALLVLATGEAEPAANLSLFLDNPSLTQRLLLSFTNPFLLLATGWTVIGLRMWGTGKIASVLGGGIPWAFWILFVTVGAGGTSGKLSPAGPVSYQGWEEIRKPHLALRYPGKFESEAEELATILNGFTDKVSQQLDFTPEPIRIHLFANHQDLERASGDFLHVKVTGSIRGRDLLFLEMPGRSVALPKVDGFYEAVRYVALMHLPFVPGIEGSPRWFVEGLAHAAAKPYSETLEREYRAMVRRWGVPDFERLMDPQVYRTPEGPIMARSVLDHIVFHHGREALAGIQEDVKNGSTFRDALFSRTRLTTSALEAGWQDSIRGVLDEETDNPTPDPDVVAPDSLAGPDSVDVSPFLPRR